MTHIEDKRWQGLSRGYCYDCANDEFLYGPRGGHSINVECTKCLSRYIVTIYRGTILPSGRLRGGPAWDGYTQKGKLIDAGLT